MEVYGDDPCELFIPRTNASDATFDEKTTQLIARMHKAITIIQFKLEGEIIRRRPEFGMDDRLLLHHIDLCPFDRRRRTDAAHQALVRM